MKGYFDVLGEAASQDTDVSQCNKKIAELKDRLFKAVNSEVEQKEANTRLLQMIEEAKRENESLKK